MSVDKSVLILKDSGIPHLVTSSTKKPDVIIYKFAFVQIEIESNHDLHSTVRKLEVGLIEQL